MSSYKVQPGDSPFSIAQRVTGSPQRMTELIDANPHKPVHVGLGGVPTFERLDAGEELVVPASWGSNSLGAVPSGNWVRVVQGSVDGSAAVLWAGYFCGPAGNQAGVQLYRNPMSGTIYAEARASINFPASPIPQSTWRWVGSGVTFASQLPVLPGLPCVTPTFIDIGPSTASSGYGGSGAGGGYTPPPTKHPGPQRNM